MAERVSGLVDWTSNSSECTSRAVHRRQKASAMQIGLMNKFARRAITPVDYANAASRLISTPARALLTGQPSFAR